MSDPITPELAALRARAEAAGLRRVVETTTGGLDIGDWANSAGDGVVYTIQKGSQWYAASRTAVAHSRPYPTEEAALAAYLRSLPEVPDASVVPEAAVSPAAASRRLLLRIEGPADVIAEEGGEKFVGEYLPRMLADDRVTMTWSTPPAASPDDDAARTRETVERLTRERDEARRERDEDRAEAARFRAALDDSRIAVRRMLCEALGIRPVPDCVLRDLIDAVAERTKQANMLRSEREAFSNALAASEADLARMAESYRGAVRERQAAEDARDAARAELAQRRRDDDLGATTGILDDLVAIRDDRDAALLLIRRLTRQMEGT